MGNKRKKEECKNDKILKKIRKLEKKLSQKKRVLRLPSSSSVTPNRTGNEINNEMQDITIDDGIMGQPDLLLSPSMTAAVPMVTEITSEPGPSSVPHTMEVELDESILSLLGDAPQSAIQLGPPVYKDIASRWQDILLRGLKEDTKLKLLSDYVIPNNLDRLISPILNAELKAALPDTLVKRDFSLQQRQKQIAITLSALSSSMDILLTNKTQDTPQIILKSLSDACRLLCDSFYNETRLRRLFIINAINIQIRNAIIVTILDKYLFGENISDKLKAAQNIKKSSAILKPSRRPPFNKNNFIRNPPFANSNRNLNQKGPSRRIAVRSDMGRPRPQPRTVPTTATTIYRRRNEHHSPPPMRSRYAPRSQHRR
ncbi:unnamed protein product [Parnassius mnemosyne]|uniref:Uncharacterized protein n=1 Tax=Parnassius mnemosyne TaxID=213953 RepID=A0AAV1M090_9NEOP